MMVFPAGLAVMVIVTCSPGLAVKVLYCSCVHQDPAEPAAV